MSRTKGPSIGVVNRFLLEKQHLTPGTRIGNILRIVEDACGLHGTSGMTPYLSLFARMPGFKKAHLRKELEQKRTLVKVRCVRRTLYMHTKRMVPMVVSATRSMVEVHSERYMQHLGVSKAEYGRISQRVMRRLKGKAMTAGEIRKALGTKGNISSIINYMCDLGLLARGTPKEGWRSNAYRYHLFKEHLPGLDLKGIDEKVAKKALIGRYLEAFGPATEKDISWWTGFPLGETRRVLDTLKRRTCRMDIRGLGDGFVALRKDEKRLRSTGGGGRGRDTVNFLPLQDHYMMAYKERERYLDPKDHDRVFDGQGNATSVIMLNGRVAGVWDHEDKDLPMIKVLLFRSVSKAARKKVDAEARRVGEFVFDQKVGSRTCRSMPVLKSRPPGGFLHPLKLSR